MHTSTRIEFMLYWTLAIIVVIAIADMLIIPILKRFTERDISLLEFFLILPKAEQKNSFLNCARFAREMIIGDRR